jgi:hypothetical protein
MKINCLRKSLLFVGLFIAMLQAPVFGQTFKVDDTHLSAGIGLLPTFYSGLTTVVPPVSLSFEKGIDVSGTPIGVGGFLGFATSKSSVSYLGDYYWSYTYIIVAARGSYHFELIKDEKWDTYVGLMLGYRFGKSTFHDPTGNYGYATSNVGLGGPAYSFFGGARYKIANNMNVFGEIGYGVSFLTLGLDFKI